MHMRDHLMTLEDTSAILLITPTSIETRYTRRR